MTWFINKFISIYTVWPMLLTVGIGFLAFLYDGPALKAKKKLKEAKWAKVLGLLYIIGGVSIFIVVSILR